MKKTITMILAVVLLVSALSITASAASKYTSGRYRGKSWSGSVSAYPHSASASLSYAGSEKLQIRLSCQTRQVENNVALLRYITKISDGGIQQDSVTINRSNSETVTYATAVFYIDGASVSTCNINR